MRVIHMVTVCANGINIGIGDIACRTKPLLAISAQQLVLTLNSSLGWLTHHGWSIGNLVEYRTISILTLNNTTIRYFVHF